MAPRRQGPTPTQDLPSYMLLSYLHVIFYQDKNSAIAQALFICSSRLKPNDYTGTSQFCTFRMFSLNNSFTNSQPHDD